MTRNLVLLLSLLVGCSSNNDATTSVDAPAPVAAPTANAKYALAVLDNRGSERIVQGRFADGYRSGVSCERQTVAGCTVSVCTKTDDAASGTPIDPGKLTASSPSIGEGVEIPLTSGYARLIQPGAFAAAGEEVRIASAGGADVPSFELKVRVPAAFELVSIGGCKPGATGCEVRAGDVAVEWKGGGDDYVTVSFAPSLDTDVQTSLRCSFAAAPGKGRVPAEALAKLPRASYGAGASVWSAPVASADVGAFAERLGKSVSLALKD